MNELINLLSQVIRFYSIVVFVNVILSWFVYNTQNMIVRRIYWTTGQFVDPALAPIQAFSQTMMSATAYKLKNSHLRRI